VYRRHGHAPRWRGGVFYFLALVTVVDLPHRVAVPTSLAAVVLTTLFGTATTGRGTSPSAPARS
jgi:uncharacterized membrane protein YfcA